jgi:hypothetical protein
MTGPVVTVDEFQNLVDRHGDNIDEWPDEIRPAALALLSQSVDARRCLDEARALRQHLQETAPKAPAGLTDRILAAALGKDFKP